MTSGCKTRFQVLQVRVHMLQLKFPHATAKLQCGQINKALEKEKATYSSNLETPMNGGAWWAAVHGVTMEKAMAPHSSTLAWEIPWTEELGGLQSMGLQRVGHD